jgi:hypothetical protein
MLTTYPVNGIEQGTTSLVGSVVATEAKSEVSQLLVDRYFVRKDLQQFWDKNDYVSEITYIC